MTRDKFGRFCKSKVVFFKRIFVPICHRCGSVAFVTLDKKKLATCRDCKKNIREQIMSKRKHMRRLISKKERLSDDFPELKKEVR